MTTFLVADLTGGNFDVALASGGSVPLFPAPGGNANAGFLIFERIIALEAQPVAQLQNGQPAAV